MNSLFSPSGSARVMALVLLTQANAWAQDTDASSDGDDFEVGAAPAAAAPTPDVPASSAAAEPPTAPTPALAAPPAAPDAPADPSKPQGPTPAAAAAASVTTTADAPRASASATGTSAQNDPNTQVPAAAAPNVTDAPPSLEREGSNYVRPLRLGLSWSGFVQAQYQRNQLSEDQVDPEGRSLNQDQFLLRRARLRVDSGWQYAAATLELDAVGLDGLRLGVRRAEASVLYRGDVPDNVAPLLVATAGVTDIPFGAELGESQRDRVFMERSIGSLALFPNEADVGLKIWGAYKYANYAVAIINGEPLAQSGFPRDPNSAKDIVGRLGTRALPTESSTVEAGVSFYKGEGFIPGHAATKDTFRWIDENNNSAVDVGEVYGTPGKAAEASENYDRWALGLDLGGSVRTRFGVTKLQVEAFAASNLDRGLVPSDLRGGETEIREIGYSGSIVQQVTEYGVVGFRAAYYDPNSDLIENRAGVFTPKNQSFLVLSPVAGVTLPNGRLLAQYDIVKDYLGRDELGVPTNAKNNQFTLRLQVDL